MTALKQFTNRHSTRLRLVAMCICFAVAPCAAAWIGTRFIYVAQTSRTEIFRGVYYQTIQQRGGIVHLVEVNLNCPGVELFVTPLHPEATANGQEYRLDYV